MLWTIQSLGPSIKDVGIFLAVVFDPPLPCWIFYPDLPNFYLLISFNIGIWDAPPPIKYFDVFYGWPLIYHFSGSCFIRTDQLDGETDWKLRLAVTSTQKTASVRPPSKLSNGADEDILDLEASIYAEAPQKDIHSFIGKFSSKEHHRECEEPLSNFYWFIFFLFFKIVIY